MHLHPAKLATDGLSRFQQLQPGEAVHSVITYGELVYGAEKSRLRDQARRRLAELAGLLPVMPLPLRASFTGQSALPSMPRVT